MLLQAAIVADPARAASYVALGDLYARHDDPQFAHKYYDEALYLDPTCRPRWQAPARPIWRWAIGRRAEDKLARPDQELRPACKEATALRAALGPSETGKADATPSKLDKK